MTEAPGSLEALRRLNLSPRRGRVAASQRCQPRRHHAETGLSRSTVSSLVATLVAEGLVVEHADRKAPAPSRSGGRPPTLLTLNPSAGAVVRHRASGHAQVRVAVADLTEHDRRRGDEEPTSTTTRPRRSLGAARTAGGVRRTAPAWSTNRVTGVGVGAVCAGAGGIGRLASDPIFPGAGSTSTSPPTGTRGCGCRVRRQRREPWRAGRGARSAPGRGSRTCLPVTLSTGVGAGVGARRARVRGAYTGTAGELGHAVVVQDGRACRCGNRWSPGDGRGRGTRSCRRCTRVGRIRATIADVLSLAAAGGRRCSPGAARRGRAVGRVLPRACAAARPAPDRRRRRGRAGLVTC